MTPSEALSLSQSVLGVPAVPALVERIRTEAVASLAEKGFVVEQNFLIDRLVAGPGHQLSARSVVLDPATEHKLLLYVLLAGSLDQAPVLRSRMWIEVRNGDYVRYAQPDLRAMPGAVFLWPVGWAAGVLTSLDLELAQAQLEANLLVLPSVGRVSRDNGDRDRFVTHLVAEVVPGN